MHLAVHIRNAAIAFQRHRRIVIQTRRTPLKQRSNNDYLMIPRHCTQPLRRRPRNRLRRRKQRMVLPLAKILRPKQLRQADQLRPVLSSFRNALRSLFQILVRVRLTAHLDKRNLRLFHTS